MSLQTPIAFIIFNRPDVTERVLARIRQARPEKLFIIADGPRSGVPEDAAKCEAARRIVEGGIDWPCEVTRDYAKNNLGCKLRVSSGLDWVFSQVEEAIILEDDCLPNPSFFPFCDELLEKYRDEERVMVVSGNNFQRGKRRTPHSYYFSKYNHVWGWATWRRAWQHYDVAMTHWPEDKASGDHNSIYLDRFEKAYWESIFDRVYCGEIDTWDYQWTFACWKRGGLTILPEVNLVENIGFGQDATHTREARGVSPPVSGSITELKHPDIIAVNRKADRYTFDHNFGGKKMRSFRARLKRRWLGLKAVINKHMPF